jgi:hypothetical protein
LHRRIIIQKKAGANVQLGQQTLSFIGRQRINLGPLLCLGRFSLREGKAKRLGHYVAFNLPYTNCIGFRLGGFEAACRLR